MPQARRRVPPLWIASMLAAAGLLATGLFLGEARQVMMNAASICLACMGLG